MSYRQLRKRVWGISEWMPVDVFDLAAWTALVLFVIDILVFGLGLLLWVGQL